MEYNLYVCVRVCVCVCVCVRERERERERESEIEKVIHKNILNAILFQNVDKFWL
jgi:hypothetical protein